MIILNSKLNVSDIDKEGKLYTNVSRAYLQSDGLEVVLDYHSILLRISKGDVLHLRLIDGEEAGDCDYQMNGMVYKIEEMEDGRVEVWTSFGGLLMIQRGHKEGVVGLKDKTKVVLSITKI